MEPGKIVEFIDKQKIVCAAVLEVKKQRLRLLTENDREIKLSANRLTHFGKSVLDISQGRIKLVEALREKSQKRKKIAEQVNVEELWEILYPEGEWIDLSTMTELCFPQSPTKDHEAAVIRAIFDNRLYFKFDYDRFFPFTEQQVAEMLSRIEEEERVRRIVEDGGNWIKTVLSGELELGEEKLSDEEKRYIEILKSYYLFDKESPHFQRGKAMAEKANLGSDTDIFNFLVSVDEWDRDENVALLRNEIPIDFSDEINKRAKEIAQNKGAVETESRRRDLTDLDLMTIDGQFTLDYDDALSIQKQNDRYRIGVHIADVGHFIEREDPVDREALERASSIYMPDARISMLPPELAEGACSLRENELRPAISVFIEMDKSCQIYDYEIVASLIRVKNQLTYYDVNMVVEKDPVLYALYDIASRFREKRFQQGALQITLPEINIWVDENKHIFYSRTKREAPGRILVSEIMILANWMMARFLADNNVPAIFRSQPEPKERLYEKEEGTLYQHWMQRKYLNRFVLSPEPDSHSGLGLDAYVTGTSPIRKYTDLITQRQIRSVLGLETPYTKEEIEQVISRLHQPLSLVSRIQNQRKRYWLLKYLEEKIGDKEEAIVLGRRRNNIQVLIPEYMIECELHQSSGKDLKPQDYVQLTIQHVNARKDIISVYVG